MQYRLAGGSGELTRQEISRRKPVLKNRTPLEPGAERRPPYAVFFHVVFHSRYHL
jgi:hypothetical protein